MTIPDLPVLSIRQPWAWLIIRPDLTDPEARAEAERCGLIKDVENRNWGPRQPGRPQNFRGEFLIHAGAACTPDEYSAAQVFAARIGVTLPAPADLERGGIVGVAEVIDWVNYPSSRWFMGPGALVLRNARPLPFVACRGALGFFRHDLGTKSAAEADLFNAEVTNFGAQKTNQDEQH